MADNDGLTGLFPDPPPHDVDRRSKAIETALRRFDEAYGQPLGDDRPAPPAAPAAPGRAKIAVLASAALVVLVTMPLLMTQRFGSDTMLQAPQPAAREDRGAIDFGQSPNLAEALPPPAPDAAPAAPAEAMVAPPVAPPPPESRADATGPQMALATPDMAPLAAAPSPLPRAALREASGDRADGLAVVVTGSRAAPAPVAQTARDRRLTPTRRQITAWQACTAADERRNAQICAAQIGASPGAPEIARGLDTSFRGDDRGALVAFDAALAAAPGSRAALLNRALVRQRLGDLDGARADFDQALRSSPEDARIYYLRSLLRRRSGDHSGADADLQRALDSVDPPGQ
jgi:hypothetical protein